MMMVALMGCVVMLLAGCLAENKLKLAVESANKRCPLSMGIAGDVESIEYEDGLVTYTLAINEQFSNMQAMKENSRAKEPPAVMIISSGSTSIP